MASHPFRLVNVFTCDGEALSGNPLCVFEDGRNLSTDTMQALARQFNLSETTFILPSAQADASVRIFTPNYEMTFAGHPTLGTAHVYRSLQLERSPQLQRSQPATGDSLTLELPAGLIPVSAGDNRWTLTALPSTWRELDVARDVLAEALGLSAADIDGRPLWVKAGKEQLIVPLRSVDAVRRAKPQPSKLQTIRSEDGQCMAYVFANDGDTSTTIARFFFPQNGAIVEDPATGSATANFGAWCLALQRVLPLQVQISQGAQVGRPSTLYLTIDSQRRIHVGGDVIEIGRGTVNL